MNTKNLFTILLSCGLATTSYGLTSKATILKHKQHMKKNKAQVSAPYIKSSDEHPDFRGSWEGSCEYTGENTEWDPNRTYNTTLSISQFINSVSVFSQTDDNSQYADDFSHEFVIGGVETSSQAFPASSLSGYDSSAFMFAHKEAAYWADSGKLVISSSWSTHDLNDPNNAEGPYFQTGADSTDETSLELVDGKLVYKSVAKWGGADSASTTNCTLTKVASDTDSETGSQVLRRR